METDQTFGVQLILNEIKVVRYLLQLHVNGFVMQKKTFSLTLIFYQPSCK